MIRKTISIPDILANQIAELAIKNDRSFSKQVVHMCKLEILRITIEEKRPIVVVNDPRSNEDKILND